MTKKEAEAQVRSITRTCKGPYVDDEVPKAIGLLLNASLHKAAERLANVGRKGCGGDFNNVIALGPLDGEERAYKCPKCGVEGTYRAPNFGVLTE